MKVLKYNAPGQAEIVTVPTPTPAADQFLVRSRYCSISAGTEMGFYRGTAPQLNAVGDAHRNFISKPDAIAYPMQADQPGVWWMGYANVAEVVQCGSEVKNFKPGDLVFSQRGHCDHHLLRENDAVKLSPGTNPETASLLALSEIAFNGILDAGIRLTETVVVFGLGPVGQLALQMAKRNGARVIAVDGLASRLELASKCGADLVLNFQETDVVEAIHRFTDDRGADVAIEVSGNIAALDTAMKSAAYNGRIVVLSFYQQAAANLWLGKEFHHKRLRLISSQIGGLCPALGQEWNGARRRQAALSLLSELQLEALISDRVTFDQVPAALARIDRDPASCNAVVIKY